MRIASRGFCSGCNIESCCEAQVRPDSPRPVWLTQITARYSEKMRPLPYRTALGLLTQKTARIHDMNGFKWMPRIETSASRVLFRILSRSELKGYDRFTNT